MQSESSAISAVKIFSIVIDQTIVAKKIEETSKVLQAAFPEGIPNEIVHDLSGLLSDVLVSYGGTAVGADGTKEVIVRLDFRDGFERLTSAIRTGKLDVIHDCFSTLAVRPIDSVPRTPAKNLDATSLFETQDPE